MEWQDIVPVALAIGFLVLWLFVLPRLGRADDEWPHAVSVRHSEEGRRRDATVR